jgi:hypothetical protein
MIPRRFVVPALPLALVASSARGAELPGDDVHTLPCRPTIACTADLVQPGALEIESGYLFRQLRSGRQWTFPILAKLTLVDWAQLQVGGNGYTLEQGQVPEQYLDDVTVGGKLHVLDQGRFRPSVSFSGTLSIPTFEGTGYLRTYDVLFTGYVTRDFGPLHADFNAGLNVWRVDAPLPQGFAALALSMNLPPPFGIMAEAYAFSNAAPVATRDGGFLFAVSHAPRPWLMFDAGGDVGFLPSTRAYSAFVGMTVVPVLFWRPRR